MSTALLLTILICTLSAGLIAFFVLLPRKKDSNRFDKITAIATFMASVATIIVGIATIRVMTYEEERDKIQNQPLFRVRTDLNYSQEKSFYDNEEFTVINEGEKTKSRSDVHHDCFLEISYTDMNTHQATITRYCPLSYYFGARIVTGNLDGTIIYSVQSGNNNELFYNLYMDALKYGENHPGIVLLIEKQDYFTIDYTDVFGENHTVVKKEDVEVDINRLLEIRRKAEIDANGKSFSIQHLDLNEILETCLPEVFVQ